MDRDLIGHGRTAYRIAQCCCGLIIAGRVFYTPTRPHIIGSVLIAALILSSIVRKIGGDIAGAISLPLIASYPQLMNSSGTQAIRLFCLVSLIWLLVTRSWTRRKTQFASCVPLAALVALGSLGDLSFLALSPVIAFAWLLQRYVLPDALRPYRTLWRSLRTLDIVTMIAALILPIYSLQPAIWSNLPSAGNLFRQYLGLQTPVTAMSVVVLLSSSVSLWWLWIAVQSGNGIAFSLTAIPVAYLAIGSLLPIPEGLYAIPAHPILLANLNAFLGLWLRGRANKRVLDSTRD